MPKIETNSGYKYLTRCPFCDFLVRPAWLRGCYRRTTAKGVAEVCCPQCKDWYGQTEANHVEPLVAFLSTAHAKLGFPNITLKTLRRIVLFVTYEHHLINCDGERDEAFGRYYEQVQMLGEQEMVATAERQTRHRLGLE